MIVNFWFPIICPTDKHHEQKPRHLRFALSESLHPKGDDDNPIGGASRSSVGGDDVHHGGGGPQNHLPARDSERSLRESAAKGIYFGSTNSHREGPTGKLVKVALPLKFDDREGGIPTANGSYLKLPMHNGQTRAVQIYRAGESAKPVTPPLVARQQVGGRIASLIIESPVIQYMNRLGRFVFNRRRESPRKKKDARIATFTYRPWRPMLSVSYRRFPR